MDPPFGVPALANGDFTLRKTHSDLFSEQVSRDLESENQDIPHSSGSVHV